MKKILTALLLLINIPLAAQDITKVDNDLFVTEIITKKVNALQNGTITIVSTSSLRGELTIKAVDKAAIEMRYMKKAKTKSQSTAIDYIDLVTVDLEKQGGGFKLYLRTPNPAPWSDEEQVFVDMEISIPLNYDVSIESIYFDIKAAGPFKSFSVPSSLGKLEVSNVLGKAELVTSNRRITVSDIYGELSVSTTNSTILAENIIAPEYKTSFVNEGGDIKISDINSQINVKNKFGIIDIKGLIPSGDKNYIRGYNGPVQLSLVSFSSGQLLVTNRFDDIEITVPENISAELFLAVEEDSKIEVSDFPFKPDFVQPNRVNLIAGKGNGLLNSSVRGKGNIYIKSKSMGE